MSNHPKRNVRYWLNLILVALVFGVALFHAGVAYFLSRPAPSSLNGITPAHADLEYQDVTLTGYDGVTLRGWYIPSKNRAAVILLHGYGANRLGVMPYAQMLVKHGYGVLLYDERASGESGGDKRTYGWLDVRDVPNAVAYLQSRGDIDPERIGALGASTGAEIVLGAAAQTDKLKAVVADGPGSIVIRDRPPPQTFEDWTSNPSAWLVFQFLEWETGVSPPLPLSKAIAKISPRPVFLISTGQSHEQRQVQHYYNLAREPKTLWNIPESPHGGGPLVRPQEYEDKIAVFFNQALLK